MKKPTTAGPIMSTLLAAALFAVALLATTAPALAQNPGEGSLTLRLEPSKASVVLVEPLYATARLRNDGSDELRLSIELSPSIGYLTVEVTGLCAHCRGAAPAGAGHG